MLLDLPTLATAMNQTAIFDYPDGYITDVIAGVQQAIADYLQTDHVLAFVQGENNPVEWDTSGYYSSLYRLRLRHTPLVPGPATSIFTALTLNYVRAVQVAVPVNLAYVTVHPGTGEVFISPGGLSGIWNANFNLSGPFGTMQATSYTADYAGGYATGISNPQPNGGGSGFAGHAVLTNGVVTSVVVDSPGSGYTSVPFMTLVGGVGTGAQVRPVLVGGAITSVVVLQGGGGYTSVPTLTVASGASYGAAPIPANYTRAAVLLCREQIAMDDASNGSATAALSGVATEIQTSRQRVRYQGVQPNMAGSLGYGTMLSMAAMKLLGAKRITRIA